MDETLKSSEQSNGSTHNITEQFMLSVMSQDSEFDDGLEVPDSLDFTIDENGLKVQSPVEESAQSEDESTPHEEQKMKPFSSIHTPPSKFPKQHKNIFIPGQEIYAKVVDIERSVTTHPLNPNLYTIEFTHGAFTWSVKKRYKHIQYLHNQLKIYRASLNIPFPTKKHREMRSSFKNMPHKEADTNKRKRGALPRFPNRPEVLIPHEYLGQRMTAIGNYLDALLKIDIYKKHPETVHFLEISNLSFVNELGDHGKEALVLKRTGSVAKTGCNIFGLLQSYCCIRCNYFCFGLCAKWHKRHLVAKDTFLAYISPNSGKIKSVVLMDNMFEVSSGLYSTGIRNGLQIINSSRQIVIKCWTRRKAKEWLEHIQKICQNEGRAFIQANPHKSFVPYRCPITASWFIDGSDYMSAIADAMENATEEIFIADWWLSPEIYLKRPAQGDDYWRLDKILERKAAAGVKVFIMIYKEVELALGINSFYSKQRLVEKNPENIKVFRHPDHARVGVFLWAHHEKIVVVDQSFAFLGGIDLCYGRWDCNEHWLTDIGASQMSSIYIPSRGKIITTSSKPVNKYDSSQNHVLLPLAIATNTVAMATTKCLPILPMVTKKHSKRKAQNKPVDEQDPLVDLENVKCDTPTSQRKKLFDVAKTTVDRVRQNVRMKRRELINMVYNPQEQSSDEEDEERNEEEEKEKQKDYDTIDSAKSPLERTESRGEYEMGGGAKLWIGKDYTNFIVKDFNNLESPYQDLVDRSTTPRMPWHDMGVMVQGACARDVSRHFIQRWNAIKLEKAKQTSFYPFLLPKSYKNCQNVQPPVNFGNTYSNLDCQVLRSVSSWSAGFLEADTVEQSIHEAYIHAIANAERYIYIENQFFITLSSMDNGSVKNRIGETLMKRILRAHREGTVFRVFVVMPLLPGFEGEVGGPSGSALRAITHWNYASISRGRDAILNQLIDAGIENPHEYITFHGLRTHSVLNGTLVTELIYVHSKLMIVDDKTVICGSANINDRSMIATRDSEIAVIIHDTEFDDGRMNDIPYPCGKFAGSLRKQLFREHLGLIWTGENIRLKDILKKSFYHDVWRARSSRNTQIFEDVFNCIPTNKVVNFQMLKEYQNEKPLSVRDPIAAQQEVQHIKGHLVDLPLDFLCNETLKPAANTVEGMMPTSLWV
ncbi:phospholipase D2 [Trichogramma pretiosum]|uniref:phospholipase D2 n=1 Tax=Trichogramma pretiosum TaxID=7493 RepID=UPI0006C99D95|nr:phospholipase D2 [Trichogramma pretiosum]XP_014232158.1 phospholipase D2 [Trichogramma pretiosum]XP_023317321.1 phospholipase D2 [Trichogramma pretiosum]